MKKILTYPDKYFQIENIKKDFKNSDINKYHQIYIDNPDKMRSKNRTNNRLLNHGFPMLPEEINFIKISHKKNNNLERLENYFQRSRISIQIVLDGEWNKNIKPQQIKKTEIIRIQDTLPERPYQYLETDDLLNIMNSSFNKKNQDRLLYEIRFRSENDKEILREKIKSLVIPNKLNDNTSVAKSFDNIKPNQYKYDTSPQYKNSQGEDYIKQIEGKDVDILSKLKIALSSEINEEKKNLSSAKIDIVNGKLAHGISNDSFVYEFELLGDLANKENIPAKIKLGKINYDCEIIIVKNRSILIKTDKELTSSLQSASIKIDISYLNQRLLSILEQLPPADNKRYHITNAKKVFGQLNPKILSIKNSETYGQLNSIQEKFIELSEGTDVSFLWGPPGTGKTHTLAQVIYNFYKKNKKILLVSNTNTAIDTLLLSLCKHLSQIEDKEFLSGSVLRDRVILSEDLNQYAEYINIDKVIIRLTASLQEKKRGILIELDTKNLKIEPLIVIKEDFIKKHRLNKILREYDLEVSKISNKITNLHFTNQRSEKSLINLKNELNEINNSGVLGRIFYRSTQFVKDDIHSHTTSLKINKEELENLKKRKKNLPNNIETMRKEKNKLSDKLELYTESKILAEIIPLREKITELNNSLKKINSEISKVRDNVFRKAKVVGSTSTQTYLRPRSFLNFDIVIIDEASMLNLPTIFYLACLSKEKVVISGDFQQLPPIVKTKDKRIARWIKDDIFIYNNINNLIGKVGMPRNVIQLEDQYRMTNNIQELINDKFYNGKLRVTNEAGFKGSIKLPDDLNSDIIIIDTSEFNPFQGITNNGSRYNLFNSMIVREIIHKLIKEGENIAEEDIGVISPYAAQSALIRSILSDKLTENIDASTVHKFQGKEKNIIIYDIPESYGAGGIGGFIKINDTKEDGARLHNVAISRARGQILFICNYNYLINNLSKSSLMKGILQNAFKRGKLIKANNLITRDIILNSIDNLDLKTLNYIPKVRSSIAKNITSIENLTERTYTHYNHLNFFEALEPDLLSANKWIIIYSGFIYLNRVISLKDILKNKIQEGVRITCRVRLPAADGYSKKSNNDAINILNEIGVNIDFVNEEHRKLCFIDDNILYHGSINILSLPQSIKSTELMTRETNTDYIESIAKNINDYGWPGKDISNVKYLSYKKNPSCNTCDSETYPIIQVKRIIKYKCVKCINKFQQYDSRR